MRIWLKTCPSTTLISGAAAGFASEGISRGLCVLPALTWGSDKQAMEAFSQLVLWDSRGPPLWKDVVRKRYGLILQARLEGAQALQQVQGNALMKENHLIWWPPSQSRTMPVVNRLLIKKYRAFVIDGTGRGARLPIREGSRSRQYANTRRNRGRAQAI